MQSKCVGAKNYTSVIRKSQLMYIIQRNWKTGKLLNACLNILRLLIEILETSTQMGKERNDLNANRAKTLINCQPDSFDI